jgi:hypothetical protein
MEQKNLLEPYEGYKETQIEVLAIHHKKLRNNFFIIGLVFLAVDMIGMAVSNHVATTVILASLLMPILYAGLAFLSLKQAMMAVIIAIVLFALALILQVLVNGAGALLSGWLFKAVLVYLHISAYRYANDIRTTEKEINLL